MAMPAFENGVSALSEGFMLAKQLRPVHPEAIVCPRCGKSTIVLHGDSTYVCLDHQCGFRHDVANNEGRSLGAVFVAGLGTVLILMLL
jgi:ribosomal protein S27AE